MDVLKFVATILPGFQLFHLLFYWDSEQLPRLCTTLLFASDDKYVSRCETCCFWRFSREEQASLWKLIIAVYVRGVGRRDGSILALSAVFVRTWSGNFMPKDFLWHMSQKRTEWFAWAKVGDQSYLELTMWAVFLSVQSMLSVINQSSFSYDCKQFSVHELSRAEVYSESSFDKILWYSSWWSRDSRYWVTFLGLCNCKPRRDSGARGWNSSWNRARALKSKKQGRWSPMKMLL